MNIWLILYVGAQIGGTWGPLPYEMDLCQSKADEGNAIIAQAKGRPELIATLNRNGMKAPLEQWRFECKQQDARPLLSTPD